MGFRQLVLQSDCFIIAQTNHVKRNKRTQPVALLLYGLCIANDIQTSSKFPLNQDIWDCYCHRRVAQGRRKWVWRHPNGVAVWTHKLMISFSIIIPTWGLEKQAILVTNIQMFVSNMFMEKTYRLTFTNYVPCEHRCLVLPKCVLFGEIILQTGH